MTLSFEMKPLASAGAAARPAHDQAVRNVVLETRAKRASGLSTADHFRSLRPRAALTVIVAFCGLILLGFVTGAVPAHLAEGPPGNDSTLFLRVVDDLRHGEPYYPAIVREQRQESYPLHPFVTVRLPTLAFAMAALPTPAQRRWLAGGLAVLTLSAWLWRLRRWVDRPFSFSAAIVALVSALLTAVLRDDYTLHELWSGELIALSLAIYGPRTWPASVAIACLALSIRELSALYFIAMAVLAWRDGRRTEAAAWALGIAAFLGGLAVHAAALQPYVRVDDIVSEGWVGLDGWPLLLLMMKWNLFLMVSPDWLSALAAPLVLLGLLSRRGVWEDRLALVVIAYAVTFMIFGRADNSYWGLMIAPLWPIGLIATGPALASLITKACPAARHVSRQDDGPSPSLRAER
jgi:hypothetical protein